MVTSLSLPGGHRLSWLRSLPWRSPEHSLVSWGADFEPRARLGTEDGRLPGWLESRSLRHFELCFGVSEVDARLPSDSCFAFASRQRDPFAWFPLGCPLTPPQKGSHEKIQFEQGNEPPRMHTIAVCHPVGHAPTRYVAINQPTLLIFDTEDAGHPVSVGRQMRRHLPNPRLVWLVKMSFLVISL